MTVIMRFLGALTTIYMIMAFLRIMLTWFNGPSLGRPYEVLSQLTDPYLNWFRRFPALRQGGFDFSPILALALLSLANNIFITIGFFGRITLGIILSMLVSGIWSAFAFIMIFFVIVLALRLFSISMVRDSTFPLWRAVESIAEPVIFRINRLIFRKRIVSYRTGIWTSIGVLIGLRIIGGAFVGFIAQSLARLPF